jgi:hypothetical protein
VYQTTSAAPIAFIERRAGGWFVTIDSCDVGPFASDTAAREFIGRITAGGSGRALAQGDANDR